MRRRRLAGVLLGLLLIVGVGAAYVLLPRLAALGSSAPQLVLPALSLALIVLALGLAGVLIRNLVRLILDRKRGILGSRLRAKLVFLFLALVLLPAVILFYGSARVIKETVEAILRKPVEHLTQGHEIVDEWMDFLRADARGRAESLADEVGATGAMGEERRAALRDLLERRRAAEGLERIWVLEGGEAVVRVDEEPDGAAEAALARAIEELAADARRRSATAVRLDPIGDGLLVHAAAPLEHTGELLVLGRRVPASIALNAREVVAADAQYRQFRTDRKGLVRFYVTLIGLIFLATLFVATWVGFYVARRITVPIEKVAAAAREISAGNLEVRVRERSGDEMSLLVDAFNEMAGELQENREVITRSTADLRRSNRALDERRRYVETLVAHLSTAVISVDPAGRVTTANPAVQRVLAASIEVGRDIRELLRAQGLDPLCDLLDPALRAGRGSLRRDLELTGRSSTLYASVQITSLEGGSGEDLGTLIMIEDLTEVILAQKALAWQEVARRLAHEIKNPLTPIQLWAQRLRKKSLARAEDLDQVLLDATDAIEREVGGLKRLVDEFSQFARMPRIVPAPVEVGEVIRSVMRLYEGLPDMRWDVEVDPGLGRVSVDGDQLRRALINLVDNAVAAVDGKGHVRITARSRGPEGSLRIEVADSGPGIRPEDRDKMFVPYFSTKKRGTGLGLAIVHKVVTDHHGSIRVEDNEPNGARFVIDLPA